MTAVRLTLGIAELTFRAGMRSRLWAASLAVALAALAAGWVGATASVWSRERLLLDASLAAASIVGSVMAVALAADALSGDTHTQGEWMLLCRPVGRIGLLLGRLLGIAALLAAHTLGLAALSHAALWAFGAPVPVALDWAFATTVVELWMTLALAALYLALSSRPLAVALTGLTWLCGQGVGELEQLAAHGRHRWLAPWLKAATHLLPDVGRVQLRDVVGHADAPAGLAARAIAYGLAYAAAATLLAACAYRRRGARL